MFYKTSFYVILAFIGWIGAIYLLVVFLNLKEKYTRLRKNYRQQVDFGNNLENVFIRSRLLLIEMDVSGRIYYINRLAEEILQWPMSELLQTRLEQIIVQDKQDNWESFIRQVLDKKEPKGRLVFLAKNGKRYEVAYFSYLAYKQSIPSRIVLLGKILPETLNLPLAEAVVMPWQQFFDQIGFAIFLTDAHGNLLFANKKVIKMHYQGNINLLSIDDLLTPVSLSFLREVINKEETPARITLEFNDPRRSREFGIEKIQYNYQLLFLFYEQEAAIARKTQHDLHNIISIVLGFLQLIKDTGQIIDTNSGINYVQEGIKAAQQGLALLKGQALDQDQPSAVSAQKQSSPSQKREYSVLLVDDEEALLKMTRIFLERSGFHVLTCNNPLQVNELIKEENVEVVVTDQYMPQQQGEELARNLRKTGFKGTILLMTGNPEKLQHLIDSGEVDGLLAKPLHPEQLLTRLRKALKEEKGTNGMQDSSLN